ncbi:MAG: DUF5675 family protein [Bacteroidaceae bacterium]|nr:DUF5675 family protein [Bacteroidaceae bacterium]
MKVILVRFAKKASYTIGHCYINDKLFCDTLEDKDRGLTLDMPLKEIQTKKVYGKTAIPIGKYVVVLTISDKFKNRAWAKPYGGKVPLLVRASTGKEDYGYSGVRIHPFNTAEESLGCIALGENKMVGKVINSTAWFKKFMDEHFMPAIKRGEKITLEVV